VIYIQMLIYLQTRLQTSMLDSVRFTE